MTDFIQSKEVMVYTEWKVHSSVVATVTSKCSDQTWPGYWAKKYHSLIPEEKKQPGYWAK